MYSFMLYNRPVVITGSVARSAKLRYISYSETDFEVFLRSGATRCTDWGEIWYVGVLRAKFHPIGVTTPKNEIFTEI